MTDEAMGWTTEELSFDYQKGQGIFLYSKAFRHIPSPIGYLGSFPAGVRR
jgi:hypothetical protein